MGGRRGFARFIEGRFAPTQSRWGIIQLLFTASFFLIAVALSTYTVRLAYKGGVLMSPPIWFWFIVTPGVLVGFFALVVAGIWWVREPRDPTIKDIQSIKRSMRNIEKYLRSITTGKGKSTIPVKGGQGGQKRKR